MSLLNQLVSSAINAQEVKRYLMELDRKSPMDLSREINEAGTDGLTPLGIAITRGDFELVEILLSFDVNTTTKQRGRLPLEMAKDLSQASGISEAEKVQHQRVYALLQSRGVWQAVSARDQGIPFSRAIRAIQDSVDNIRGAEGQKGALVLGITGEGKSTLINFLHGVDYKEAMEDDGSEIVTRVHQHQPELAVVGNSTTSETLYPKVFEAREGGYVHVDMPGFEDTRGTAEEICAAASICMLSKQLASIQAICLVVSWAALSDARMVNYRKSAENIGNMIGLNPSTEATVVLIVTKPKASITVAHVRKRLENLAQAEKFSELTESALRSGELSADDKRKYALKRATEAILRRGASAIIIADVTRPEARASVHTGISALQRVAQPPDRFNLNSYSRYMVGFQLVLENIILQHNELKRTQLREEDKTKELQSSLEQQTTESTKFQADIEEFERQKAEPFTEAQFDHKIRKAKDELNHLRQRHTDQQKTLDALRNEVAIKHAKLDAVTNGDQKEKLIDTVNQSWTCEKTEDITYTAMKRTGRVMFFPGIGPCELVQEEQCTIAGKEKTVSESINYPSTVPIMRFVDRSSGGRFECSSFTPGVKKLSGTFISTPGANGGVSLCVDLYGDPRDFPETKERESALTSELVTAQDRFERLEQDACASSSVDAASDALQKFELEKIAAVGNRERTEMVCELQIKQLTAQKTHLDEKNQNLTAQLRDVQQEVAQITLQLEVNQRLFTTVRTVIVALGLRSEVIDEFMMLSGGPENKHSSSSSSTSSLSFNPSTTFSGIKSAAGGGHPTTSTAFRKK